MFSLYSHYTNPGNHSDSDKISKGQKADSTKTEVNNMVTFWKGKKTYEDK